METSVIDIMKADSPKREKHKKAPRTSPDSINGTKNTNSPSKKRRRLKPAVVQLNPSVDESRKKFPKEKFTLGEQSSLAGASNETHVNQLFLRSKSEKTLGTMMKESKNHESASISIHQTVADRKRPQISLSAANVTVESKDSVQMRTQTGSPESLSIKTSPIVKRSPRRFLHSTASPLSSLSSLATKKAFSPVESRMSSSFVHTMGINHVDSVKSLPSDTDFSKVEARRELMKQYKQLKAQEDRRKLLLHLDSNIKDLINEERRKKLEHSIDKQYVKKTESEVFLATISGPNFDESTRCYQDYIAARSSSTYPNLQNGRAGDPICDFYYVRLFEQGTMLIALADGCSWGEASKQAARRAATCFVRYLQDRLYLLSDTRKLCRVILKAFAACHSAIIEGYSGKNIYHAGTATLIGGALLPLDPQSPQSTADAMHSKRIKTNSVDLKTLKVSSVASAKFVSPTSPLSPRHIESPSSYRSSVRARASTESSPKPIKMSLAIPIPSPSSSTSVTSSSSSINTSSGSSVDSSEMLSLDSPSMRRKPAVTMAKPSPLTKTQSKRKKCMAKLSPRMYESEITLFDIYPALVDPDFLPNTSHNGASTSTSSSNSNNHNHHNSVKVGEGSSQALPAGESLYLPVANTVFDSAGVVISPRSASTSSLVSPRSVTINKSVTTITGSTGSMKTVKIMEDSENSSFTPTTPTSTTTTTVNINTTINMDSAPKKSKSSGSSTRIKSSKSNSKSSSSSSSGSESSSRSSLSSSDGAASSSRSSSRSKDTSSSPKSTAINISKSPKTSHKQSILKRSHLSRTRSSSDPRVLQSTLASSPLHTPSETERSRSLDITNPASHIHPVSVNGGSNSSSNNSSNSKKTGADSSPLLRTQSQSPQEDSWVFVFGNVGDCKVFLYSPTRDCVVDITFDNRNESLDARDCGGRLGPYGSNGMPDLRNLMVVSRIVKRNDLIIIVSDGVHDNLDPQSLGLNPAEINPAFSESWNDLLVDQAQIIKSEYREKKLAEIISQSDKTPSSICDELIDYCFATTVESRRFMETYPSEPLPEDFTLYPGKMDHSSVVCIQVGGSSVSSNNMVRNAYTKKGIATASFRWAGKEQL